MTSMFNKLFTVTHADQARVRTLIGVALTMMSLYTVYALLLESEGMGESLFQGVVNGEIGAIIATVATYGLGIGVIITARRGLIDTSGWLLIGLWLASGVMLGFRAGFTNPDDGTLLMILVIFGAVFLKPRNMMFIIPGAVIILAVSALRLSALGEIPISFEEFASLSFQFVGIGVLFLLFQRTRETETAEALNTIAQERLNLATLTTQIASLVLQRTALNETLDASVNEILTKYPRAYHVQIFLLDESRRTARLAASTGEVGALLLERKHSLPVGSQSVIGQVTGLGKIVVARAGSTETVHRRNEFLPETVVEAAFPLRIGDLVIGALDMQSKHIDAFAEGDLPIFQALADNIAIAIDNARLIEQTEARALENEQLAQQANLALREVERLNRELTAQSWENFIAEREDESGLTLDLHANTIKNRAEWTETLSEAIRFNHVVQRQTERGEQIITVPIMVRGQVVGAMEFEVESDTPLPPEDLEMIREVSERLGVAAENARLFQNNRRAAQREATLNAIATRLQASNSIDNVLGEAARGLRETLGANKIAIRIGTPPAKSGEMNGGANGGNGSKA